MPSTSPFERGVFSNLPSVDALMRNELVTELCRLEGIRHVTAIAREQLAVLRAMIAAGSAHVSDVSAQHLYTESVRRILEFAKQRSNRAIRRVINATGVVLHTNLGRAPLSDAAMDAIGTNAMGYCSVEYDIKTGLRGPRGRFAEELLTELTMAEGAIIVNNCAAATLLVLSVFASAGEAIISRGELVEIGGDFRIPDVLVQSGAKLREVGTTNRTRIDDYAKAITPDTRLILRVHPSNYRVVGFTEAVDNRELAELAQRNQIIMFEDAGSGALVDLDTVGFSGEPVISTSIRDGVDVVSFSGDKLLGGPQCGIIVGKPELIERLRGHPLYRALRVSKLVYAALEATLLSYLRGTALDDIPALRMLTASVDDLHARCVEMIKRCEGPGPIKMGIVTGESVAGGGCFPDQSVNSPLIALAHNKMPAERIDVILREFEPPVITRIERGQVLIDLRTVARAEEAELATALNHCGSQNPS
jgi:L-seryl-tRNA(Ser) seleniumtransferase